MLDALDNTSVRGLRDGAILAVLLGLRREEAAQQRVNHMVERRGIRHLTVQGKDRMVMPDRDRKSCETPAGSTRTVKLILVNGCGKVEAS